ncbi:MAG: hypothetical protein M1816_005871 [Peltula sp. TS41687]|nr:MAG: hypothetical protein M1816_005871 [Peltula sp. TS41687]
MARERPTGFDAQKGPAHSLSLKVLRISEPSSTDQSSGSTKWPEIPEILTAATLGYPTASEGEPSILNPLLSDQPAFGSAYVGQIFSCSVCVKNELSPNEDAASISGVRVAAEMQTPSQTIALELDPADAPESQADTLHSGGQIVQKMVRFDLKEQGNHILAITVTYTETSMSKPDGSSGGQASSGRVRSFRKLYQFLARQCLAVRTKTVELVSLKGLPDQARQSAGGRRAPSRLLLEAQLENMSRELITLEQLLIGYQTVHLTPRSPLQSTSLNWDVPLPTGEKLSSPTLNPDEVVQVAFLIQQQHHRQAPHPADGGREDGKPVEVGKDGRMILGQLNLEWRTAMGDRGILTTGWLTFRAR